MLKSVAKVRKSTAYAKFTLPVRNNYLEMAMLAQTDGTMKTVA